MYVFDYLPSGTNSKLQHKNALLIRVIYVVYLKPFNPFSGSIYSSFGEINVLDVSGVLQRI